MRFLLVDDHKLIRVGLKLLIKREFPEVTIDEAEEGTEVFNLLRQNEYDALLLDINFPGSTGLPYFEQLITQYPEMKVIVLSYLPPKVYGMRYIKAGAKAYIDKADTETVLVKCLHAVLSGKRYLTEELIEQMASKAFDNDEVNPFDALSNREVEIVRLMLEGESQKDIKKSLNIQSSTIGTHKQNIFKKLDVANVLDLKKLADSFSFH